jgi:2'-5' RNA ligase
VTDETLRTFIALELDEALRRSLVGLQSRLKRQVPAGSVRWVAPEGMHLTLKFLGDTPAGRVPEIAAALQQACSEVSSFNVTLEGRGCFPNFRQPRVIWVAVHDENRALPRLQEAVEAHVAPLGWPTEARGFTPHLTLGRVSRNANYREIAAVGEAVEKAVVEELGRQRIDRVKLIRSDLRPTGALYTTLAEMPLRSD